MSSGFSRNGRPERGQEKVSFSKLTPVVFEKKHLPGQAFLLSPDEAEDQDKEFS